VFDKIDLAPPDAIFGLLEAYEKDGNPLKLTLCSGVYQNESGLTPVFSAVKRAEAKLLETETEKNYLEIGGSPDYRRQAQRLILGAGHPALEDARVVTVQTPGGTGGLRIAADFLSNVGARRRIWLSDPSWANHETLFAAAGYEVARYRYYDADAKCIDFDGMIEDVTAIPRGELVLLHGCCHNPTGWDPTAEQWDTLSSVIADRELLPLFDFAYQGLGRGLRDDAAAIERFAARGTELLITSSNSKNFGLYNERVGALTVVCEKETACEAVLSQLKSAARASYSNPPAHGAAVVAAVLADEGLRTDWERELDHARTRIQEMRVSFAALLKKKGASRDFSWITRQSGMFSYTGLDETEVAALRQRYSIYVVGSGRINVAGLTPQNIDRVTDAIIDVTA